MSASSPKVLPLGSLVRKQSDKVSAPLDDQRDAVGVQTRRGNTKDGDAGHKCLLSMILSAGRDDADDASGERGAALDRRFGLDEVAQSRRLASRQSHTEQLAYLVTTLRIVVGSFSSWNNRYRPRPLRLSMKQALRLERSGRFAMSRAASMPMPS